MERSSDTESGLHCVVLPVSQSVQKQRAEGRLSALSRSAALIRRKASDCVIARIVRHEHQVSRIQPATFPPRPEPRLHRDVTLTLLSVVACYLLLASFYFWS